MIENAELVMQMLEMYQMYKQQVPVELEEYLRYVAKTGNTLFQWTLVKPFIREKILNVISEFAEHSALPDVPPYPNVDPFNYEAMKTMLLERFDTFNGPPFTIQRLCELLSCPRKEYSRVDKFMRAVEKNILVVSTCELRQKREEPPVVNGVPDRWENGKEPDVNMDLVDKSNVISDVNSMNGSETVESLLNELVSMKTPETKLDELKTELKEDNVQATHEIESNFTAEEPKPDTEAVTNDAPQIQITDSPQIQITDSPQIQITDSPQAQITNSTEVVEQVSLDVVENVPSTVEPPMEQNLEVCEIQPVDVVKEPIAENNDTSIEELKDLPNDISIENIEPITEEPVLESIKSEAHTDVISADVNRVEGSIIHQTPDNENKIELEIVSTEQEVVLEKSNEGVESMDVQVEDQIEDVTESIEPEVSSDRPQNASIEPTEIKNDEQQNEESPVVEPTMDTIPMDMDVEPEKTENDVQQETIPINEETEATEPNTIAEEPQVQDDSKLTESE